MIAVSRSSVAVDAPEDVGRVLAPGIHRDLLPNFRHHRNRHPKFIRLARIFRCERPLGMGKSVGYVRNSREGLLCQLLRSWTLGPVTGTIRRSHR